VHLRQARRCPGHVKDPSHPHPRQQRQGPSFVSHGSATQRRMI